MGAAFFSELILLVESSVRTFRILLRCVSLQPEIHQNLTLNMQKLAFESGLPRFGYYSLEVGEMLPNSKIKAKEHGLFYLARRKELFSFNSLQLTHLNTLIFLPMLLLWYKPKNTLVFGMSLMVLSQGCSVIFTAPN